MTGHLLAGVKQRQELLASLAAALPATALEGAAAAAPAASAPLDDAASWVATPAPVQALVRSLQERLARAEAFASEASQAHSKPDGVLHAFSRLLERSQLSALSKCAAQQQ